MFSQDEATTLTSAVSSGATSVTLNDDIAAVGQTIVIGGGADPATQFSTQEERQVSGKSGSGPYTYSFSPPLTKSHTSGVRAGCPAAVPDVPLASGKALFSRKRPIFVNFALPTPHAATGNLKFPI